MIDQLNDENFLVYAIKSYNRPNFIMSEFEEDFKRIKYVKRLIRKYKRNKELKERLLLNHIIILGNVFGIEATVKMLYHRMDEEDFPVLKTILLYLNYQPSIIKGVNNKNIISADITIDINVAKALQYI